jgi:hypothetical protein
MRPEFRVWHLFVLVAAVALPLALGTQFPYSRGLGIALAYVTAVVELALFAWWWTRRVGWAFAVLGLGLVLTCILQTSAPDGTSRVMSCQNNVKNLALALRNYENAYGSLPPAVTYDASGRPMHSWRVLILPYLERQDLYDFYRFDEPWDSPHNLQLAASVPDIYRCPTFNRSGSVATPYLAIVGDDTLWPDGVGFDPATSGVDRKQLDGRLMLIEVPYSQILWTEPRDLPLDELPLLWQQRTGQNVNLWHNQGRVSYARFEGSTGQATEDNAAQLFHDVQPPK